MIKVIVFNNETNQFEIYWLDLNDAMPYVYNNSMLVREFRGSSNSSVVWTTTDALKSWNETRIAYNAPIPFRYAFKRIWEGGHGRQSQHYAGVSFDVAQALSNQERIEIYDIANELNVWSYVEPLYLTPSWVHFDKRYGIAACGAGYPTLQINDRGVYVLILQDALNALGYSTNTLDGIFGNSTLNAVKAFQSDYNLSSDGVVGCSTWTSLTQNVVGIGLTDTVLNP